MIKTLDLKIGKSNRTPLDNIKTTSVNLFIGPSNSGKSTLLAEIRRYCTTGCYSDDDLLLNTIEFAAVESKTAAAKVARVTLPPAEGESIPVDHIVVGNEKERIQIAQSTLLTVLQNPNTNSEYFCEWFLKFQTLVVDAKTRIALTEPQHVGILDKPKRSNLQVLFRDNDKRKLVRSIVANTFGRYLVVDPTNLGYLRYRLSDTAPQNVVEECGIHVQAVEFHQQAALVEEQEDGLRSFIGIITEVIAGDHPVLLIDQPEAFLSPQLAYALGNELVKAAEKVEKKIFIATDSLHFMTGCLNSNIPVNMIRLTNQFGSSTARLLTNKNIGGLVKNPLLHSFDLLRALFHDYAIVTISAASRAFYQEVNERLLNSDANVGIKNCLFLSALDNQTAKTIVQSLRVLGIPTALIVDIDIINDTGEVWANVLKSVFIPQSECQELAELRRTVKSSFDESGKDMKQDGGVEILEKSHKVAAKKLVDDLAEYGLFVVYVGEMESWLSNLGATGHESAWLSDIFSKMGDDPDSIGYVRPAKDDVWEFMANIRKWLIRSSRMGMPI
jgi:ABC-type cobalamin/Fe3+-siderophores transport system ATPase subunit